MAKVSEAQQQAFLKMIVPIAQRQAKKHNNQIYASVCIAQAIHESGWGTSKRMKDCNALFGIKVGKSAWKFGTAWKGAAYKSGTTEYYDGINPTPIVDSFRAYDSVEDATEDYFDMLCHCKRYKPALNQPTPKKCIEKIIAGGYATGPAYVNAIMDLINGRHNLAQYDIEGSTVKDNGNVDNSGGNTVAMPTYKIGTTYTTNANLFIRLEPAGTKTPLNAITPNAKKNAYDDGNGNAILKSGTKVTCKGLINIGNDIWMHIPSGWIAAYHSKKIYIQ